MLYIYYLYFIGAFKLFENLWEFVTYSVFINKKRGFPIFENITHYHPLKK